MKTTVSVIKADIGSVSGHCVAHPELIEICETGDVGYYELIKE